MVEEGREVISAKGGERFHSLFQSKAAKDERMENDRIVGVLGKMKEGEKEYGILVIPTESSAMMPFKERKSAL